MLDGHSRSRDLTSRMLDGHSRPRDWGSSPRYVPSKFGQFRLCACNGQNGNYQNGGRSLTKQTSDKPSQWQQRKILYRSQPVLVRSMMTTNQNSDKINKRI